MFSSSLAVFFKSLQPVNSVPEKICAFLTTIRIQKENKWIRAYSLNIRASRFYTTHTVKNINTRWVWMFLPSVFGYFVHEGKDPGNHLIGKGLGSRIIWAY